MKLLIINNLPAVFAKVKLNNKTLNIRALLDTGSEAMVLDKNIALLLGCKLIPISQRGIGLLKDRELWECMVTVQLNGISKRLKAYVIDFPLQLYNLNLIIGWKFFKNKKLCLDFKKNILAIY